MNCSRRCDYFLAVDGNWYMTLGDREYSYDDHDCTNYGPFETEEATDQYRRDNFSNPGGGTISRDGVEPVPEDCVDPSPKRGYNQHQYRRRF